MPGCRFAVELESGRCGIGGAQQAWGALGCSPETGASVVRDISARVRRSFQGREPSSAAAIKYPYSFSSALQNKLTLHHATHMSANGS